MYIRVYLSTEVGGGVVRVWVMGREGGGGSREVFEMEWASSMHMSSRAGARHGVEERQMTLYAEQ